MAHKVLIIEDDPLMYRMYDKVFKLADYEVEISSNGEEGLLKAQTASHDIILLDVMMPKMNGLDVLKQLKSDEKTKDIPVVILTNSVSDKVIKAAMNMGASEYVLKSDHDPMDVVEIIKRVLAGEIKHPNPPVGEKDESDHS